MAIQSSRVRISELQLVSGTQHVGLGDSLSNDADGGRIRSTAEESASAEHFESGTAEEVGLVITALLIRGFGAGTSLLQQSSTTLVFWVGEELIMVLLRDREDSASVCSKKTYFTARSSARPSVITCSRSILQKTKPNILGLPHNIQ